MTPMKQTAYLAGPMRGYVEYNFPAFHAAAAKLRAHGLDVWSPAENDVNQDGFDPAKDTAQPMRHYMKRDLPAVLDADMVCVLPGWEKSQGACLEVHVARTCGIPVYWAENMQPVAAPEGAWISVMDQLPEESLLENQNLVLAWFDWKRPPGPFPAKELRFAEIVGKHWRPQGGNGNFDQYVTHWMPCPRPPQPRDLSEDK